MKRAMSALLCSLLFLSLLPAVTPPAQMISNFSITISPTFLFVGDHFEWSVSGEIGTGSHQYRYSVVKNSNVIYQDPAYHTQDSMAWIVSEPGSYMAYVRVWDTGNGTFLTKISTAVTAQLRPGAVITRVEPAGTGGTTLKVNWNPVFGAEGYEVWRSASQSGPFTLAKAVTAATFTNTYLTPGTRYFYKVRATDTVKGVTFVSGEFGAVRAGVALAKPVISSATATGVDRVKLVIAPVAGATGYRIYSCASAGGTYKLIKTTTVSTLTVTGLKPNTQYYFKAEAYKRIYTTNYYGPMSGYKAAKTLK